MHGAWRRKFDEAKDNAFAKASYVLTELQKVYFIERQARELALSHEQRFMLRQEKAVPILSDLKSWMIENYKAVVPKSPIGQALHYCLERWDKLMIYAANGKLEIDNNLVENAIRPVAIGRKNYLFAGSILLNVAINIGSNTHASRQPNIRITAAQGVVHRILTLGATITLERLIKRGYESMFSYYAKVSPDLNEPLYA